MKHCSKCGQEKCITSFQWISTRNRYDQPCKNCKARYMRTYAPGYRIKNRQRIYQRERESGVRKRASDRYAANMSPEARKRRAEQRKTPRQRALKVIRESNRRARKIKANGRVTQADIDKRLIAQGGLCWYCNTRLVKFHVDHVMPLVRGGSNNPENVVLACPFCNQSKGARTVEEWEKRRTITAAVACRDR